MLTTNSEVIEFNKEFYDFFTIICGEINPIVNENETIKNIEDYAIWIDPEDIEKVDDQDYDSLYNTCIGNGRFYIKNIANPDAEDIVIQAEGEKEIFVADEATELMKSNKKGFMYFKDMDDDTKLFEMIIYNKELTRPLYGLMNLLNKKADYDMTYEEMSQQFLDLLIESGIDANAVAAELIINRLIRSVEHPYDRPDFNRRNLEPYEIYRVSKALEKNRSPFVGLSFQDIKKQFLSDELYTERTGTSFIDPFFWTEVPTENLKKYRDLVDQDNE